MPGLVKVGRTTTSPEQRVKELSSATGVASGFDLFAKIEVNDVNSAEAKAHRILAQLYGRPNQSREFFAASAQDALDVMIGALQEYCEVPDQMGLKQAENLVRQKSFTLACIQFEAEFKERLQGATVNLNEALARFFGIYIAACSAISRDPIYPFMLEARMKGVIMASAVEVASGFTNEPEELVITFVRRYS